MEIIGYVIAIFLFAIVVVTLIIIRSTTKVVKTYKEQRKYFAEQKDEVACLKIVKLDDPVSYYMKKYTHLVTFKSLNTSDIIDLYVEEYDALNLLVNEEYKIIHEGLVLFELKNKLY